MTMIQVHETSVGTYHPVNPGNLNSNHWTANDVRGYSDIGPSCSECESCECVYNDYQGVDHSGRDAHGAMENEGAMDDYFECVGLSFAFCNLDDGSESLCEDCFNKIGDVVPCNCQ